MKTLRLPALVLLALLHACGDSSDRAAPKIGEPLRHGSFKRLDGEAAQSTEWQGKTVVLNFWATWCPPCRKEMPSLQRLADALPADDYRVVAVSVDDDANLVREFVLQHGIRFPVYLDTGGAWATGVMGVQNYPETLIVAPDGRIRKRIIGERAWDSPEMRALIEGGAR